MESPSRFVELKPGENGRERPSRKYDFHPIYPGLNAGAITACGGKGGEPPKERLTESMSGSTNVSRRR